MKTTHQLARELLALADLPVLHFDPSFADVGDGKDSSTEPKIEVQSSKFLFATICGTPQQEEPSAEGLRREIREAHEVVQIRDDEIDRLRGALKINAGFWAHAKSSETLGAELIATMCGWCAAGLAND